MNLLRILLIALAVWIIIVLIRNARAKKQATDQRPEKQVENMVECAYCGVHLPENEAVEENGKFYCSDKHRQQDQ